MENQTPNQPPSNSETNLQQTLNQQINKLVEGKRKTEAHLQMLYLMRERLQIQNNQSSDKKDATNDVEETQRI